MPDGARRARTLDAAGPLRSIDKARRALGFEPRVALRQGLRATIDDLGNALAALGGEVEEIATALAS